MAEIKIISEDMLRHLAGKRGLNLIYLEKDYFLTCFLYFIKDIDSLVFKGGTALNKIFLNHLRLSEDLDFSSKLRTSEIENEIKKVLPDTKEFFPNYVLENKTNGFFRMKIFYNSFFMKTNYIILDVNSKASIIQEPIRKEVPHFYSDIPKYEVLTLDIKELIAEKIRTLITRNQPRDYFDVYNLIRKGHKIYYGLVEKKMKDIGQDFEIERIFKNAKKVFSRWDEIPKLTNKPASFVKVIRLLQEEFKYKIK